MVGLPILKFMSHIPVHSLVIFYSGNETNPPQHCKEVVSPAVILAQPFVPLQVVSSNRVYLGIVTTAVTAVVERAPLYVASNSLLLIRG